MYVTYHARYRGGASLNDTERRQKPAAQPTGRPAMGGLMHNHRMWRFQINSGGDFSVNTAAAPGGT